MSVLATAIILLIVLFPVLLPAAITAVHAVTDWRRNTVAPNRITRAQRRAVAATA